ncbi:NAD(P)-dependent oxidoreductase [Shigella flexneri]
MINLLPIPLEQSALLINNFEKGPRGAYILNLARGVHVVEDDLLAALDSGKVKAQCWMFLIVSLRLKVRSGNIHA